MGSDNPAIIIIEGSWEPNGNNMTVERWLRILCD